jgi:trehalose-6-phosphate synthase
MARMHEHLTEHNIYRWAAEFLKTLSQSRRTAAAQPRDVDVQT